jgi:curved DNA-binding protein CbpA
MKDYYRTLGVLDDAEDIIVRAAYKALAQRYHPDKWKGDKTKATKRMQDINEAYEVLSDLNKRKQYDEDYFRSKPRDDAESESSSSDFEDYEDESDEAWQVASEFYPKIIQEYNELKKISHILANTYRSALISTQNYKDSTRIRLKYENDYLERFYGSDKEIQQFAKQLLLNKNKRNKIISFTFIKT